MCTILIADDEALPRKNISQALEEEGHRVEQVQNGNEALDAINEKDFDVVLTDLKMPGLDGLAVLKHVREVSPQTLSILMTAYSSVETAVEAMRLGAQDYVLKPLVLEDVVRKVKRLMEHKNLAWEIQMLRWEVGRGLDFSELVGQSHAIEEVRALIMKVAPANSTVLITGESGVGKEVVARTIHRHSMQKERVFLPVNCSAIPDTLLESQLFGHLKGSFTGASGSQEGLFQRAQGGTIFLDEIGEMPSSLQPKLLRAIEAKEVLPVGSTRPVQVEVRILASTNRDLQKEIDEGRFREDLYYRLNVININVPPLRERREDIPLLVEHLIRCHNREMKRVCKGVDSRAMKMLMGFPWKGNIRELDNILERAMILGGGEWITPKELPDLKNFDGEEQQEQGLSFGHDLQKAVEAYEKNHIQNVLLEAGGDRTLAAKLLGLSRSSLYRKIDRLGIASK